MIREAPDGIEVFSPWNAAFVHRLKEEIAPAYRSWDNDRKCWWIATPLANVARRIARVYFDVEDETAPAAQHAISDCISAVKAAYPDWARLWLLPNAPTPVVEASWRALCRIHHPDVGGDDATMKGINNAHDNLVGAGGGR